MPSRIAQLRPQEGQSSRSPESASGWKVHSGQRKKSSRRDFGGLARDGGTQEDAGSELPPGAAPLKKRIQLDQQPQGEQALHPLNPKM